MKNVMAQSIPSVPILPRAFVILEKLQMPHVGAGRFVQPLPCVASISSRVRRESWDESKKKERTGEGEGTRLETLVNTKIRLTMLCLSVFELYSRWVPLLIKREFNWYEPTNRQLTNFVGLSVPTNSLTNFDLIKREFNWHEPTNGQLTNFVGLSVPTNSLTNFDKFLTIFGKISVRKTIWELEFSKHLL